MNRDIFRLVFNEERNAWIVVAETVRGRGKKSTRRRLTAVALGLAAASVQAAPPAIPAINALPAPSTNLARPFVFAGSVNGGQPTVTANANGGRDMVISTPSRTLGLNWDSFSIGASSSLTFNQPDAASRVLNRIWSNDPSVIMGKLTANGQVYLINQNGILFGNGAQVNVGGLVASALNLSDGMADRLLNKGLPAAKGDSLEFAWDGRAGDFNDSYVTVEAGAHIKVPSGGRVVLIAPKTAENLGHIEGGDGAEAILAAGGKVLLTAPDDPSLRGLLVETQSFVGKDDLGNSVSLDGSATNKSDGVAGSNNGRINLGNGGKVSLAALAVNQKGIVNATRAVNLNGTTILVSGSGTTDTDHLTINQRGDKAEIDWVSGFDVAAGKKVEFVQSSTGAVAYNYIHDADRKAADGSTLDVAGRSRIDGTLTATGSLFLINEKGISFGGTADVKAASFVATGLGVNPTLVRDGIFSLDGVSTRAFYLTKSQFTADDEAAFDAAGATARAAFAAATVDVARGARIATSAENGYVLLIGSAVNQNGGIATPKGQTLLAAGADVYLKPPFSAGLRGFMAEVNPLYVVKKWESNKWEAVAHGAITNTGTVESALGNITLVGHDIVQAGTLRATTSATANGSIRLIARDQLASHGEASSDGEPPVVSGQRNIGTDGVAAYVPDETYNAKDKANQPLFAIGTVGGTLTLAAGSVTTVDIDGSSGKTVAPDQTFLSSSIEAIAKKIVVEGRNGAAAGAEVTARGGRIQALASDSFDLTRGFVGDPVNPAQGATPAAGIGIFVGDGARLDVAGVTAQKSVADLFIEVELRGDEFANNPVQRDGMLRGEKAWVDIRDKVAIADLTGWTGKVGQTVEEKAAAGGTIALRSTGSVIVKQDATLGVSGGGVDYAAAEVSESRAVGLGGQSYRLNDAPASAFYTGLVTVKRQEAAYREGKSAGTVELVGNSLAVDGKLVAATAPGARQRNVGNPASDHYALPLGGRLIVRDGGQHYTVADRNAASDAEKLAAYTEAQIAFVKGAAQAAAGLDAAAAAGPRLELSSSLVDAGFSRFDVQSDGRIDLPADVALNLGPGGELKLAGRQVYVAGDVTAPSGSISLTTRDMSQAAGPFPTLFDGKYSTLTIDGSASLSTAGGWINDYLDGKAATSAKTLHGGKIALTSAYDIDLRAGSRLDVSGGGRLGSDGKLEAGNAGSITLTTGGMGRNGGFDLTGDIDRRDASLFLDGTLAGQALGTGGKLEINTSQVRLGSRFAADSRNWSRAERLAAGQVGTALDADFFNQGGFYEFALAGRDGLTVADNTRIAPSPTNWSLPKASTDSYRYRPTGSALGSFAPTAALHPDQRGAPTRLTLATRSLNYGDIKIGDGAYLGVSPQGSISLESWAQLTLLGTLEAPAGTVSLSRPANRAEEIYNFQSILYSEAKQSESIFLGANSRILAAGTTKLDAATRNAVEAGIPADTLRAQYRYKGEVLPGGKVDIDAGLGYLITARGSLIDVSGTQDSLNTATAVGTGIAYPLRTLGSAGGRVSLAAREGMFLDGGYAAAGKQGALGGVFSLRLYELASNATWNSEGLPDSMTGPRQLTLLQSAAVAPKPWTPTDHPLQWTFDAEGTDSYLTGGTTLASSTYNGKAALDVAPLTAAGFGSWYLSGRDEIRFDGKLEAAVANQLRLDAPKFTAAADATTINFTAAAVQLGNQAPAGAPVATASVGGATATFTALDIGITGNFSWNGFGSSTFNSDGETHFDSTANSAPNRSDGRKFSGQMTASGDLAFAAARLSPSTYSDYRVDLTADPTGSIAITRRAGAWADKSLSAGGRLEFAAKNISHSGTVTAPLGEIVFNAPGGTLTLEAGSITSVAADQTLLLGQTDQSGRYWQFQSSYWDPGTRSMKSDTYNVEKAPAKAIRMDAADTLVRTGATLDLSGGGEVIAAEFTPGPGGKTDILKASEAAEPTVFAILPTWNGRFAPADSQAMAYYNVSAPMATKSSDGTVNYRYDSVPVLKAGDQVQLAADAGGLAAGTYTLLPARYALLPGAYLVAVKPGSPGAGARMQSDNSWLVGGARVAANADGKTVAYSPLMQTFEVASPSVVGARALYQVTTASDFFYDQAGAKLPGDAGQLTAVGRSRLEFDPAVIAMRQAEIAAANGRQRAGAGLQLDLAAKRMWVTDGSAAAPAAGPNETAWSVVGQDKLKTYGADSLLLGGARSVAGDTTNIETVASELRVVNTGAADTAKALKGPELMLAAKDDLTIAAGSRVASEGSSAARNIVLLADEKGSGDSAFLRTAEGPQASLARQGTVSQATGNMTLETTAQLAGRSVIVDGTRSVTLDGTVELGKLQADGTRSAGGAIAIGAGRINVIDMAGVAPVNPGLTVTNAYLQRFAQAEQIRLASYDSLDLYGNASLGTANLQELVISAAGIGGYGAADDSATIAAKNVVFDNPSHRDAGFTSAGKGKLVVEAETITFDANVKDQTTRDARTAGFALRGFKDVELKAGAYDAADQDNHWAGTGQVRFAGLGVTQVDGGLTIDAGRVSTATVADHLLMATGAATIKGGTAAGAAGGLGGALELEAKSIDVSGRIETPAGRLTLAATGGDATDGVTIRDGATIAAEGVKVAFADTAAHAPGGRIALRAAKGNVVVEAGADVSVSANTAGGDAGTLAFEAREGTVSAGANTLRGSAAAGAGQGELVVDANTVDVDALAAAVGTKTQADGTTKAELSGRWDIRRRSGNISVTKTVKAERVRLAADKGDIDVAGTIDASAAKGGAIELYANRFAGVGGRVDLRAGSILKANATEVVAAGQGTAGRGGTVIVGVSGTDAADEAGTGIGFEKAADGKAAATIDVSTPAGSQAADGKVIFSTPRTDTTTPLKTLANAPLNNTNAVTVLTAGGTASAFTLTPSPAMAGYEKGMLVAFKAPATNGAALTLNVSGRDTKAVLKADGTPPGAGEIAANQVVLAVYDGSAFRIATTGQQDTGTGSGYAVALPVKPTMLTPGQVVVFQAKSASGAGTVTLTLNGDTKLKANLKKEDGSNMTAGHIAANQLVTAVYTGSEFRVVRDTNLVAAGILGSQVANVSLAGNIVGAGSVQLQGLRTMRVTGDQTLDYKQQALLMAANAQAAAVGAQAIRAAADPNARLNLTYAPGIEVRATGNITVADDWNFGSARYLGAPGVLSLRAGGDLNINGTLSDGFVANGTNFNEVSRDAKLGSGGDAWSYRLVAGADGVDAKSAAASPLATRAGGTAGSIDVAANKLVRTGRGSIDMAAAKDIRLLDRAAVYTAGSAAASQPDGFTPVGTGGTAANSINAAFPAGGGDITLTAAERIVMAKITAGKEAAPTQRHINQWLFRAGGVSRDLQWWPRIASFQQGVAAFGGGDIRLTAGTDIKDFTAAIPTNGRVPTINGERQPDLAAVQGGGNLIVRAGGAVTGGQFYAETGRLDIAADSLESNVGIALGNAEAHVVAKGDATVGNIFNPMWTIANGYAYNNGSSVSTLSDNAEYRIRMGTYGDRTAVDLVSIAGKVALNGNDAFHGFTDAETHRVAPARVKVAALNGDIAGSLIQAPSAEGQLDLLASGSISLDAGSIKQLDVPTSALPSLRNPIKDTNFELVGLLDAAPARKHAATPWHRDTEPSRLIALGGDIVGRSGADNYGELGEPVRVEAAGEVRDLSLAVQHPATAGVSSVKAGGDIRYSIDGSARPSRGLTVNGPGRLEVTAGGSVDLGDSAGITTKGNLENPYLPAGGADVFVMAGASAPDYAGFRDHLAANNLPPGSDTSDAGLRSRFLTLLRDFGREAVAGGGEPSYEKGRALIRALFPKTSVAAGDIDLFYSAVRTEQGGGIDLFAPGGSVTVGIANPSSTIPKKNASEQGLFTFRGGAIRALVDDSFLVNQSRVFTLDGGDIMIWADKGSIDAGKGAKTVSATPPPVLVIRDGQIVLDASNSVSGSGIGVLASRDDSPISNMDLYAPQGAIDAGDAGIFTTGDFRGGAKFYFNTRNITAGGSTDGVPAAVAAPAPAPAPAAPAAADKGAEAAATAAIAKGEARQGILTVEVLGAGAETGTATGATAAPHAPVAAATTEAPSRNTAPDTGSQAKKRNRDGKD